MYKGDRSRKETLVEYGFRLPSAMDNRPLKFDEWELLAPQRVYVSATPSRYEEEHQDNLVELLVRPTGLTDPDVEVRPASTQIDEDGLQFQPTNDTFSDDSTDLFVRLCHFLPERQCGGSEIRS